MERIDYRADHHLSDSLALQFFMLKSHLLRRSLILAGCMLGAVVFTTLANGAPLKDSLTDLSQNAGRYLALVVVGLAVIYAIAMILAVLAWRRRPRPREIRAIITPDGITLKKDGFSYGARWADANLVAESSSAYLMRFNQLYMRLPKRGFTPEEDRFFREIALVALPRGANRLRA